MDCLDTLAASEAEIGMLTSGLTVRLGSATDLSAASVVVTPGVLVQGGLNLLNANVLLNLGLSPLQILGLDLNAALTGTASASILGGSSQHTFLPYQEPVAFQRAPGGVGSIGSQLSSSLSVQLGSTVLNSTATNALRSQLGYVFTNLDALIIDPLLAAAGVTVAGADVRATNLRCEGAGLRLVD